MGEAVQSIQKSSHAFFHSLSVVLLNHSFVPRTPRRKHLESSRANSKCNDRLEPSVVDRDLSIVSMGAFCRIGRYVTTHGTTGTDPLLCGLNHFWTDLFRPNTRLLDINPASMGLAVGRCCIDVFSIQCTVPCCCYDWRSHPLEQFTPPPVSSNGTGAIGPNITNGVRGSFYPTRVVPYG